MQSIQKGAESLEQVRRVFALLQIPDATPTQPFRSLLAVIALFLASAPTPMLPEIGADPTKVALEVAEDLIKRQVPGPPVRGAIDPSPGRAERTPGDLLGRSLGLIWLMYGRCLPPSFLYMSS